jgi:aryl-alcohol dehydrogenase-like predicted oxidoreductase
VTSTTLRRASRVAKVSAVQADYSVFSREIEGPAGSDLLATCLELGVAVVVAMPLGRGMITANFGSGDSNFASDDSRPQVMPRFQGPNLDANAKLIREFKQFSDRKGCTVPQLALAWLLKKGNDIIPIPGARKLKYLEENWGSLTVSLSDEEEAETRKFAETTELVGAAAPPQYMSYLYRDTIEEST